MADFKNTQISIRAAGSSEILVEAKSETRTDGTTVSRALRRRFVVPGMIKCEAITSAMSTDGVLTITVPKDVSIDFK